MQLSGLVSATPAYLVCECLGLIVGGVRKNAELTSLFGEMNDFGSRGVCTMDGDVEGCSGLRNFV